MADWHAAFANERWAQASFAVLHVQKENVENEWGIGFAASIWITNPFCQHGIIGYECYCSPWSWECIGCGWLLVQRTNSGAPGSAMNVTPSTTTASNDRMENPIILNWRMKNSDKVQHTGGFVESYEPPMAHSWLAADHVVCLLYVDVGMGQCDIFSHF